MTRLGLMGPFKELGVTPGNLYEEGDHKNEAMIVHITRASCSQVRNLSVILRTEQNHQSVLSQKIIYQITKIEVAAS